MSGALRDSTSESPAPSLGLIIYLTGAAFLTYFCMYAFRKPFAASTYGDASFFDAGLRLKTALILGQVCGYALSKLLGIKICSEAKRAVRARWLLGCILTAEAALVVFAIVPGGWKVVPMFLNGLPLGLVWGLVVAYLEGRRRSELLLAGLSCSFIVSSGMVKDVGLWLLGCGVTENWMPAAVGALFLLPFAFGVWMLEKSPQPTAQDIAERTLRIPMQANQRWQFFRAFWPGLLPLIAVYFFLTAFRDFRDNYGVEVFTELGYRLEPTIFTRSEVRVALGVLVLLGGLAFIRDSRRALAVAFALMAAGLALIGIATWLLHQRQVTGFTWMTLIGFGSYLAYVPFGSMLFDRVIAATHFVGTAVFAIYVADAAGYVGSICIQVYRDLWQPSGLRAEFLCQFALALSVGGIIGLAASCRFFLRRTNKENY